MIRRSIAAMALAVLLCSSPLPVLSAWPTTTQAHTLYGVSIGENASYALTGLGLGPSRFHAAAAGSPRPQAEYRVALADYGKALLALSFDTRIKSITVARYGTRRSDIVDPYGIKLADSIERLTSKRGLPTSIDAHHDYVYGPATQVHWVYGFGDGLVTSISVSD
jgi:hypothetical protein